MSSRKRKHPNRNRSQRYRNEPGGSQTRIHEEIVFTPDPVLFIQAHEADVIRGPKGRVAAQSLEVKRKDAQDEWEIGSGLIRWGGDAVIPQGFPDDDNEDSAWPSTSTSEGIWVDRYDIRLLLDALPFPTSHAEPRPNSPSGWSDLPSDSEDMFFLSPMEIEDFHREKRRKLMERAQEERLKARMAEDGESVEQEDVWGGSDEEPDESQKEIMRRTANSILTSPNPAQLEMRILANHGGDKRFAFLRGRWKRSWEVVKGLRKLEMRKEQAEKEEEQKKNKGLGFLADYGDSDDSTFDDGDPAEDTRNEEAAGAQTEGMIEQPPPSVPAQDDEAAMQARRARAKEWMEKRKALG
ncbi:hypothetical protein D9758_004490 [Tetrapyrgos nigripes]|uniref:Uncharacterized protein n=1 Tax=Tetrapyrgos nigripes TaxID=182062 RepID=A0A8H5GN21_9AGAR|nr:hypothetical protein D9758_004490 [Tetrapyrgos nigripes]